VREWRRNAKLDLKLTPPAVVSERLKLAWVAGWNPFGRQSVIDQVIAVPDVFVTGEAEEIINDAAARGGELDLFGTHVKMLADEG
jgi:hypothetical protein